MINLVSGDMFKYTANIRINTVNCVGVMGKGVALAFKKRHPAMFKEYVDLCKNGQIKPGKLHVWKDHTSGEIVVNFPTKRHWRENSRLVDIEAGLVALRIFLQDYQNSTVTLPALGCGHGGLDWNQVLPLIKSHLENVNINLLVFQPIDSRNYK